MPPFPLPNALPRELELWGEAWRTPQACAWSLTSERWRWRTVAMWVRTSVRCEEPDAPAALFSQIHRFADQIGMTTAGLAEMGWAVAEERDEPAPPNRVVDGSSIRRRLRAIESSASGYGEPAGA